MKWEQDHSRKTLCICFPQNDAKESEEKMWKHTQNSCLN